MVRTYEECVEEQVECPCKTPCAKYDSKLTRDDLIYDRNTLDHHFNK